MDNLVKKQVKINAEAKNIMNKAFIKFMKRIDNILYYYDQAIKQNKYLTEIKDETKEEQKVNIEKYKEKYIKINIKLEEGFFKAWTNGKVGTEEIVELI